MSAQKIFQLNFGRKLACLLPRSIALVMTKIYVAIRFLNAKREKQIIKKNLSYCGIESSSYNVFRTFVNYGICLMDLFRVPVYDRKNLEKMVEFKGSENLTNALQLNRGVILITGHIGNWDLGGVYLASQGFGLSAVVEDIPRLSDFYNFLRSRTGMKTIFMKEIDQMILALKKNEILVLLGDRDLTGSGLRVKFLGGEKSLPRGPATFAIKYKTPIVFASFTLNEGQKPYQLVISEPIISSKETQVELTQIIANRLSDYIRQYPTQWFVFEDEWLN